MLNCHFIWESKLIKPGKIRSLLFARPRGIILIESPKISWFSRRSGGGGWSLLSESQITQVRSSG